MAAATRSRPPEPTRQVPVQQKPAEARPVIPPAPAAQQRPAPQPARPQPPRPQPRPRPLPPLPTVRRNGYDKVAVDARLRQLAADHAELGQRADPRRGAGQRARDGARRAAHQLDEAKTPSYAGLGGRASAMLRLAEEEAAEMRAVAQSDADEIREQAARDAQAIKADAAREAEDLRIVHTKELDDHRARVMTEAEQERSIAKSEAVRPGGQRPARGRPAPAGRPAGGQRAADRRPARGRAVAGGRGPRGPGGPPDAGRGPRAAGPRGLRAPHAAPSPRPSGWSRRPRRGPRRPRSGPARRAHQATEARDQARRREAEGILTRARREAEQIIAAANTQAESIIASGDSEQQRQVAAAQGRGRPAGQAPRRDHRPARLAARRRRRLRATTTPEVRKPGTGRTVSTQSAASEAVRPRRTRPSDADPAETEDTGAVGGPSYLGEPGPPLDHRAPFYRGLRRRLRRAAGLLAADQHRRDRLDADPDRGGAVPGRRTQPRGRRSSSAAGCGGATRSSS